jgi:hypothetical protein
MCSSVSSVPRPQHYGRRRADGVEAEKRLARERAHSRFDPELADLICADGEVIFDGLDDLETWDAVIEGEPALAVVLSVGSVRRGAAGGRELRRSEIALYPRPLACGGHRWPPRLRPTRRSGRAYRAGGRGIGHIYSKIGASTRATASPFAMQHGLLPEEEFVPEAAS